MCDDTNRRLTVTTTRGRPLDQPGDLSQELRDPCEDDLRLIVEAVQDCIFITSPGGRIVYANTAACAASGYELDELLQMSLPNLLRGDAAVHLRDQVERLQDEAPSHGECRLTRKDGSHLLIEVALQQLPDRRRLVTARDSAQRERLEQRAQTGRRMLELLAGDAPLTEVLEAIVLGVEKERPGSVCAILLHDEVGGLPRTIAAPSLPPFFCQGVGGPAAAHGSGDTAACLRQRVVLTAINDDPATWAPLRELARRAGIRSCWFQPVLDSGGCCLGTFALYQRVPSSPEPEDLQTLDHAAMLTSLAVEHSRRATAARQQHDLLSLLLQQIHGVMFKFRLKADGTSNFTYLSETFRGLWEMNPEGVQVNGRALWRRIHPEDREMVRASLLRSAETTQAWCAEYRVCLPGQGVRWQQGHALAEKRADGCVIWVGYALDITERKDAELRERRSEQGMQLAASIFGHAHEGIIITDAHGRILDINQAGCEITGYARGEAVGRQLGRLKSNEEDPRFWRTLWKSLKSEGSWRGEITRCRRNGEHYSEMTTISAVRDSEGAISHYVMMFTDLSPLKETQQRLENLAHYDILTQLPNRVLAVELLQQAMERACQRGHLLAICSLDLDDFKALNESRGHDAGDRLLIEVGKRLTRRLRSDDTAARTGGDEFLLLLSGMESTAQSQRAIARIMSDLSKPIWIQDTAYTVTASIGAAVFPHDDADPDTLIRHADQAMYLAKQSGGNRYHLFDPEDDRLTRMRIEASARVRSGLDAGEFSLLYQPKVEIRGGMVVGVEALVRWNHPQRGQLVPDQFLPLIESSEWSSDFEDWVLEEAIGQMAAWWQQGCHLGVSINVSAGLLQQGDFLERLARVLVRHREAPAEYIELELLENAALDDISRVSANIEGSKSLGVLFAIDDFGTGYSSLTYLRRLPVSTVKIDRSFICHMLEDAEDLAIVESVIQLAKVFGRSVIAEGVETAEQGRRLSELNCDLAQGFGIAPPMPPDDLMAWLKTYEPDPRWFSSRPS